MKTKLIQKELLWGLSSFIAAALFFGIGVWAEKTDSKNLQFICFLLIVLSALSGFFSILVGWKKLLLPKKEADPTSESGR